MTTETTTRPERPLLLPGQAAAHEGPVDLTVMYVVHHAFRRDLAAFAAAAARTPAADRATWRALARRWRRFTTVLHHHHTGEDTGLWPLLLARVDAAGDAEGRAVLEAMEAEHAEIDPLLESCGAGFARLSGTADDDARAALAVRLAAAREHLARHLQHEERDALRLVQQHLTQAEWDVLDEEHFQRQYSPREMLGLVAWVLHGLPQPAVDRLAASEEHRALVRVGRVVGWGFARRERRTFRYAAA